MIKQSCEYEKIRIGANDSDFFVYLYYVNFVRTTHAIALRSFVNWLFL